MEGHPLLAGLEQALGFALILFVLLNVFLTVLYARMGTGLLSRRLACLAWAAFRGLTRPMRRRRDLALSYCGPVILVLLVTLWVLGLVLGTGLVIHPRLGTSLVASSGPTATDLATAMYEGGGASRPSAPATWRRGRRSSACSTSSGR